MITSIQLSPTFQNANNLTLIALVHDQIIWVTKKQVYPTGLIFHCSLDNALHFYKKKLRKIKSTLVQSFPAHTHTICKSRLKWQRLELEYTNKIKFKKSHKHVFSVVFTPLTKKIKTLSFQHILFINLKTQYWKKKIDIQII